MIELDAEDAWRRFSAIWPYDAVPYRRAAAETAFAELTYAEREQAIRCACLFVKAWRAGARKGSPDARAWIVARGWQAFDPTPTSTPQAVQARARSAGRLMAERLPDGSYRLHPDSPQIQRWRDYERRMVGRSRLGILRPSEWPPDAGVAVDDAVEASRAPACAAGESPRLSNGRRLAGPSTASSACGPPRPGIPAVAAEFKA
jgi:hypothetical protein